MFGAYLIWFGESNNWMLPQRYYEWNVQGKLKNDIIFVKFLSIQQLNYLIILKPLWNIYIFVMFF